MSAPIEIPRASELEDAVPVEGRTVKVRSTALSLVLVLLCILLLRFARQVFVPIVIAVLLAYALEPLVMLLRRLRIPRFAAASLLLLAFLGGSGLVLYGLRGQAAAFVDQLPESARKLRTLVETHRREGEPGPIESIQQAATEIEKTASAAAGTEEPPKGVTRVQVVSPTLRFRDYLWSGGHGVVTAATEVVLVVFLVYFLLLSGDLFKRKLLAIAGSALSRRRITTRILDEINRSVERFLLVRFLASVMVAATIWPALLWMGLDYAAIWAIVAGLLNVIPYIGPGIVTCALALAAYLQFGTPSMAIVIAGVTLGITSLEGWLVTPKLMGRACRMNDVAVFVGLIFWGWLWGVWGLLLAVPMLMVVKTVCDHLADYRWFGELLGE
jgi:predicted PurR-regulated permease PerM